jgi:hypothetical protein
MKSHSTAGALPTPEYDHMLKSSPDGLFEIDDEFVLTLAST